MSSCARKVFCCTTLDFGCGCCCCGCCVMVGAECEGAMFLCLTREDAGGCWGTRNPSFFNTDPVEARRGMSAVACDAAAFGVSKLCCFIFCNNKPLCLWRCWLTVGFCCCCCCCGCWIGCCCIMLAAPSCSTGKPCNNVWKQRKELSQWNASPGKLQALHFFFKKFGGYFLFVGRLIPHFGLLMTSEQGFKAKADASLACFVT